MKATLERVCAAGPGERRALVDSGATFGEDSGTSWSCGTSCSEGSVGRGGSELLSASWRYLGDGEADGAHFGDERLDGDWMQGAVEFR